MEVAQTSVIIIVLIISIAIILGLREFNCWYWKVNERIKLQEETNSLLKKIIENKNTTPTSTETQKTSLNNKEVMDNLLKKFKQ